MSDLKVSVDRRISSSAPVAEPERDRKVWNCVSIFAVAWTRSPGGQDLINSGKVATSSSHQHDMTLKLAVRKDLASRMRSCRGHKQLTTKHHSRHSVQAGTREALTFEIRDVREAALTKELASF